MKLNPISVSDSFAKEGRMKGTNNSSIPDQFHVYYSKRKILFVVSAARLGVTVALAAPIAIAAAENIVTGCMNICRASVLHPGNDRRRRWFQQDGDVCAANDFRCFNFCCVSRIRRRCAIAIIET
jgi:hypothetical protein